ncbi:DALR anticodon-binding domain-containing protein [Streptomyces oceani]|uniref:arginine--tRNA ligase n=1 Tax=Streptomyces oceani TaxID=1075402 RepID=A0A1E7KP19_9ACTN|nr:DALR anticodon-binding domain-containing protein [Streptomyces oceani]OEV05732.1 hypothetical protein AN216_01860 [Streptomyces oceani]
MTPAQLSRTVLHALHGLVDDTGSRVSLPERAVIESPPRHGHADYATGVLLRLARAAGTAPGPLARRLAARLERQPGIGRVEAASAGFVTVTLNATGRAALVRELCSLEHQPSPTDDPARDAANWTAATARRPAVARASAQPSAPARAPAPALAQSPAPAQLLVRTEESSPLFRVQYAHARARALLRNGAALGVEPAPGAGGYACAEPAERALLALLADHARVAAAGRPDRHARHLDDIARAFRHCHDACPPLPHGPEKPEAAHRARLALAEATGTVLAGGLTQLGVTAPAHL